MRFESAYHTLIQRSAISVDADPFDSVNTFIDFLAELPPDAWLAIGALTPVEASRAATLEETIVHQQLQVDAWRVKDDVQTLAFLASRSLSARSTHAHGTMARARTAAERAGLAIVARPWLSSSDVAELLSPFSARRPAGLARAR